ncbi:MAG: hypothetical protein R6X32_16025 [Chloroflexota bacterium]|jgi:CRP-like cAMP-binding protein
MAFISPIDLLSMSSAEQTVLRCLTRHPQLTVFDLASRAQMELGEVEQVLNTLRIWLVQQGLLAQKQLKSLPVKQAEGYLHRGSWVGLAESLSETPMATTYTAVTSTTLLTWSASDFFDFARQQGQFTYALSCYLSQQLAICQHAHLHTQSKLWVSAASHQN